MTIGIDISMLVYQGSGVATYTYNLVKNLLKIDKKNHYRLFYSSLRRPLNFTCLDEFRQLGAKVYEFPFPSTLLRLLWGKYNLLPVELLIGKVDVFYSSDFLRPPLNPKTRGITTVHDLTWKIFPEYHTDLVIKAHERKIAKTIKYGDTIITDSENTKKDLIKYFPEVLKKNKIFVVYPGVDERFQPITDQKKIQEVLTKYGIHLRGVKKTTSDHLGGELIKRYLLYVGAIEPRKNLTTAINVFHQLINLKHLRGIRQSPSEHLGGEIDYSDFEFLIVSKAGWKNDDVFALIDELKLKDKIKFVKDVSDNDLPYFYNACKVFIYLSKYEGFGLPPLEALMCNKPVLVYKNSSLSEIFESNYPFAQPENELDTLIKLLSYNNTDHKLYREKFNWEKSALQLINIY